MSHGVIASVVAPHTPRIGIEKNAPPFARALIDGLRELGEELRALQPDLVVLLSSHWVSTFTWYVTTHRTHEGVCVADEAPDLIPGIPYRRPGAPDFANRLLNAIREGDIPCGVNETPHFDWDYGSLVPMQYIDPDGEVPICLLPSVICSDVAESRKVGGIVHRTALEMEKKVVFIASTAMSHKILRGPEKWPTEEHQAMDSRFMDLVKQGKIGELLQWAPAFCKEALVEMDGRPMGGFIGALEAMTAGGGQFNGRQFGPYTQSSGSGNAALAIY